MTREILISTEVFSLIWRNRLPGEESESEILLRLLSKPSEQEQIGVGNQAAGSADMDIVPASLRHAYWWEVVKFVLEKFGRPASLTEIYREVNNVCKGLNRPMPKEIEATIRGTLEDNSADSDRYKNVRNIFRMPHGKHSGVWALRSKNT